MDDLPAETPPDPLALFEAKTLIDAIDTSARSSRNAGLAHALAVLHNTGQINALEMATWATVVDLPAHRAHFFERFLTLLLPDIDAPTDAMLGFIATLTDPERRCLTSFEGAETWMRRRPAQARAVLDLAVENDPRALPLLSLTLRALGDLSAARSLVAAHDDERRLRAIHAIGWIPHPDAATIDASVSALAAVPGDADDATRAQALEALTRLFSRANTRMTSDAVALLERLLEPSGDITLHHAAKALYHAGVLGEDALNALLVGLLALNPDDTGMLETLDYALAEMMRSGEAARVLQFLPRLMDAADERLSLSRFDSVLHDLMTGSPDRLADTVVDWLLSGQVRLSRGLSKAIQRIGGAPVILAPDLTVRTFSGPRLLSLSRKAIGYFDMQPVTAASLVVAAMRPASRKAVADMEALLFEGLLLHYGGPLEDYLSGLPKSDKAQRPVQRALKRKAAYVAGLQAPGRIAELRPSEQKRRVEHERHAEEMRRSFEAARKSSKLLNLFPTTVMLYGRQSMSFMVDFNGQRQSTDVKLQSHGTTVEIPRGLKLNPMGLEEITLIFRAEPVAL